MFEAIVRTKVTPPPLRPKLVPRARLDARFQRALDVPLILVSAPAGFGKTTATALAARALQKERKAGLAWLSLDEQDDDPGRFWRYVAAALQEIVPEPAGAMTSALDTPQPPPVQSLLPALLNGIAASATHLLFILDDVHLLGHPDILGALTFLVERAPPTFHLFLVTRADPPLPLHRLRAQGKMLEIRARDLRFDEVEATAFLTEAMGLALEAEQIARLAEQTEGWVAGLQLAALALEDDAGSPARPHLVERLAQSNRYIADYLAEEVLARQPPQVQGFLLQTSILERLTGPLCDAVTQREESQALLETLAQRNLFLTPLAGDRRWFRYHRLFADLLRGHLRRQQPGQIASLHRRAAAWHADYGDPETAIEHSLRGDDYERAGRLLDTHARRLAMEGRARTLERWLRRLPAEAAQALPRANLAFAWALLLRGRYGDIEPHLQAAEAAIPAGEEALLAELYALRASLAGTQGRAGEALDLARKAIAGTPADNLLVQALSHFALAGALREQGQVDAAIAAYEEAIPLCRTARLPVPEMLARAHLGSLYTTLGQLGRAEATTRPAAAASHPAAGAAIISLGAILLERNQLSEAERHLQRGLSLAEQSGHNAAVVLARLELARLRRMQGAAGAAQSSLEAASAHLEEGAPAWIRPLVVAARARQLLAQGAVAPAAHLLNEVGDTALSGHLREQLQLVQARLLIDRGAPAAARARLDEILKSAAGVGRRGHVVETLLIRALLQSEQGEMAAARADLREALALAEPEGYVRLFLDEGPPLAALLAELDSPYARRLLQAFPAGVQAQVAPAASLPEPLTERELEVLSLLARGLTYRQIADDLVLSVNTVRHHVKGLYGKLQVDKRTLAVEKGRSLGLL